MSLISRLYDAVRSWRRRPEAGRRAAKSVGVSMEQLDHRQLLSVNFTGNVATDFPASTKPGVVVLPITPPTDPPIQHPVITEPALVNLVKVSGFDVKGLRVSYSGADDTLSVGIEQPLSQQPTHPGPVIAGDADNNGDDGSVNPAVTAIPVPGLQDFKDFQDFGGSEFMGVFLDLKEKNFADVAAGYAVNDPRTPKEYQVAVAVVPTTPPATDLDFGTGKVQQPGTVYQEIPAAAGNVYKVNSPAHPNLEFSIAHFSQLYLQETGKPLTSTSVIGIGATAGSGDDPGIGEAFFPEQKFTLGAATVPPPTTTCPPVSPPVIINPHENQHINTAHPTLIRVNVLGSSGFNVSTIEPNTVTLGGAHPLFSFDRFINKDNHPDATFVFKGTDVHLPAGYSNATVSGTLTDGTTFSSAVRVFNRDSSYYPNSGVRSAEDRQVARTASGIVVAPNSPVAVRGATAVLKKHVFAPNSLNGRLVNSTLKVDYAPKTSGQVISTGITHAGSKSPLMVDFTTRSTGAATVQQGLARLKSRPVPAVPAVKVKRDQTSGAKLPAHLRASVNRYARHADAVKVSTGASAKGLASTPEVVGSSAHAKKAKSPRAVK